MILNDNKTGIMVGIKDIDRLDEEKERFDKLIGDDKNGKFENMTFQWTKDKSDNISIVNSCFNKLEAGYYDYFFSNQAGKIFLTKREINTNKIYRLPNKTSDIILNDIDKFWTLEEEYKKYQRVYKRNYLIYSAPGTGKTSLISLMCKDLIEKYDGIVLSINTSEDLMAFEVTMKTIRKAEPDRKIIVVIEDIDTFLSPKENQSNPETSLILNLLDGNLRCNGVVFIATTNYIENMQIRFKNRPSRFDRVVEFPLPDSECRKMFIEKSVQPEDITKINIDEWVEKTEGYTIDHINELILLFFVFQHTEEEAFEAMNQMRDNNDKLTNIESVRRKKFGV